MNSITTFLENSFLKTLLDDKSITDISFNGEDIFYESSISGRLKADFNVSHSEVYSFLRHLANLSEKNFSYTNPILDISFANYRLNAVFSSIARKNNAKVLTFSLRIIQSDFNLDDDEYFFDGSKQILQKMVLENASIVIGGKTGVGKTQLQKWLISQAKDNTRSIIIDVNSELDNLNFKNLDITCWTCSDLNQSYSYSSLIKNALRNNPDYLIVAETRGEEAYEMLLALLSGHPLITTIHSLDCESIIERLARMASLRNNKLNLDNLKEDFLHHINYLIYIKKDFNQSIYEKKVRRYIEKIIKISSEGEYIILWQKKK